MAATCAQVDRTSFVLEYAHRLLASPGMVSFPELQDELARAFGATISEPPVPEPVPLDHDPHLLEKVEKLRVERSVTQAVRIAGRLAHDFGNYLTGILGFTELAMSQVEEGSLSHRYLNEVWQAATNGAGWVHKLQILGRRKVPQVVTTDLAALLREQEDRVRPRWKNTSDFFINLEARLPSLAVDQDSLRHVLSGLLDNAFEALPGSGTVTLAARTVVLDESKCRTLLGNCRPGTFVEIIVQDSGSGLPVELRQSLFADVFFSTKPRHRGLGLVTAYWIVHMYEGGMQFGPHPEQGTTVRVFFPVTKAAPLRLASAEGKTPGVGKRGPSILVVDDDPTIVQAVCRMLDQAGYSVRGASGGTEALAMFQGWGAAIQLVITDIAMPGMSGLELSRRLLEVDAAANVLYISGYARVQQQAEWDLIQRFGLLRKPFEMQSLLTAVQTALTRRPAE